MSDSDLIEILGGSSALAKRLGYPLAGGVQRVQNWKRRGIPPRVKLEWPELFLRTPPSGSGAGLNAAPAAEPRASNTEDRDAA